MNNPKAFRKNKATDLGTRKNVFSSGVLLSAVLLI